MPLIRFIFLLLLSAPFLSYADDKPNILWITSEDHGPHLGCYGDTYATTPNLDKFATVSLRYTRASSNAPVCAPARTTIISGMYPPSTASQHMRSRVPSPKYLRFFPTYLQEAGYYTSNNSKEDYNLITYDKGWDDSSKDAHWKNGPEGKPFFSVFNFFGTHESQIRNENKNPLHDPALVSVPPYFPDTPKVRKDLAQYYDRLSLLDTFFQEKLDELEEAGLSDSTIVIFFADHGSGMPRSKRYPGWSGLNVPMMVHVPERFSHLAPSDYMKGAFSDRLVSFVDLAPSMLSLAGIEPPDYHQGNSFLGEYQTNDPDYSYGFRGRMDERPDFCRSVTDGRYIYIRNYMPHLPHGQYIWYQQQTGSASEWYQLYKDGKLDEVRSAFWEPRSRDELFDLQADPHETVNLAETSDHKEALARLQSALDAHMQETRDLGLIPEPMLQRAILHGVSPAEHFSFWHDDDSSQSDFRDNVSKYWNIINLLSKDSGAIQNRLAELVDATKSDEPIVAVAAAECLALHAVDNDFREQALETLIAYSRISNNELILSIHALNALDHVKEAGIQLPAEAKKLKGEHESIPRWAATYRKQLIERF